MDLQQVDDEYRAGRLSEEEWCARVGEILETAYLAADTPQRQSGLNGDAAHWERRRRVIVEAIDHDGSFLDIGCANGLLMETVVAWAAEHRLSIEPYGLEISPRLAALTRARLPRWADRVFVGSAATWDPPRRFDFVRTELVYAPEPRQPALVSRLLAQAVAPGGRLIVCAYRERGAAEAATVGDRLRAWGFAVAGEAVALDATDGGVATRVAWVDWDQSTIVQHSTATSGVARLLAKGITLARSEDCCVPTTAAQCLSAYRSYRSASALAADGVQSRGSLCPGFRNGSSHEFGDLAFAEIDGPRLAIYRPNSHLFVDDLGETGRKPSQL